MSVAGERPQPIFIQGIMARSGTNFLNDLLVIHPDCGSPTLHEDYLLSHAHWLEHYVQGVIRTWDPAWGRGEAEVYAALGRGLLELLSHKVTRPRVVTKTPNVHNLHLLPKLLPSAHILLLVRDGRAVVESGVKSFSHWTYEKAINWWAAAARTVLDFEAAQNGSGCHHRVVRYESLHGSVELEVERILKFLGLDSAIYNFARARALPVRGSSTYRGASTGLDWSKPIAKTEVFNPMERWQSWPRARHERFNWVAGPYMRRLGYTLIETGGRTAYWRLWNRWHDQRWAWQMRGSQAKP